MPAPATTDGKDLKPVSDLKATQRDASQEQQQQQQPKEEPSGEMQPDHPIDALPAFWAWWGPLEGKVAASQASVYLEYGAELEGQLASCEAVLSRVEESLGHLRSISHRYAAVQDITTSLSHLTATATQEQEHLTSVMADLLANLSMYSRLEGVMRALSAHGTSAVVLDPGFPEVLASIDEALAFFDGPGRAHHDAAAYKGKFRQCLTRGLMLVKMHFVTQVRAIGRQLEAKQVEVAQPFRQIAPRMRPLVGLIAARFPSHVEYYALYQDCLAAYFHVRFGLVKPILTQALEVLAREEPALLPFSRSSLAWLQHSMTDEEELFRHFFDAAGQEALQAHLDTLAALLYSTLRPRILHESSISVLSELCQCFQLHLRSAAPAAAGVMVPGSGQLMVTAATGAAPPGGEPEGRPRASWVHSLLSDAQDRLSFKAQSYIRMEIGGFQPMELDLLSRGHGLPEPLELSTVAEPLQLEGSALAASGLAGSGAASSALPVHEAMPLLSTGGASLPPTDGGEQQQHEQQAGTSALAVGKQLFGGGEWYPTVSRTVRLMAQLHPAVPETVFEDLSQEAIGLCLHSLQATALQLTARPGNNRMDGQFFAIKNLLMLREQLAPFDTRFIRRQEALDFSGLLKRVSSAMRGTASSGSSPGARGGGAGAGSGGGQSYSLLTWSAAVIPKLVESRSDMKLRVDMELKSACEDVILECSKAVLEPITSFLLKVQAFLRMHRSAGGVGGGQSALLADPAAAAAGGPRDVDLMQHAFSATLPAVQEQFRALLASKLSACASKMRSYLGDKGTERILFRVIHVGAGAGVSGKVAVHAPLPVHLVLGNLTLSHSTPAAHARGRTTSSRAMPTFTSSSWTSTRPPLPPPSWAWRRCPR
jgi:hypothetical protein